MPGFHVRGAHVYHHSERFQMRTPSEHMKLIQKAEQGKIQQDAKRNVKEKISRCERSSGKREDLRTAIKSPIGSSNRYNASVVLRCSCHFFITALKFKKKLRLTKPLEI